VSQDYDQTNPEHAVLLCKALGFVNVTLHIHEPIRGMPGLFANYWHADYAGVRYGCQSPPYLDRDAENMAIVIAKEINRIVLGMVAKGMITASTQVPPHVHIYLTGSDGVGRCCCGDAQLTFEDGGKSGSREPGPRAQATQKGAATSSQGATAQGAARSAGNVAEPQFDPTPDRVEHPPSSLSIELEEG